jgi:pimeloyl-ACP methyl ester carboxylesterase
VPERLVLVHGLAGSPRWWRPLLPYLRDYDVRYADPREPLEAEPDDVLIGHSLGGFRAAQFAALHDVRKLVLVAPVGLQRAQPWRVVGSTSLAFTPTVAFDSLRWGPLALLRSGLEALTARIDASTIRAPTLIVWGERDRLVPSRLATEWHKVIAGSRVEIIARARHVPMVDAPSAFAEVLLDFLRDA